ncbi:MAG: hypothetical protein G01um101433_468 [Parcubacteria group bacterium Gr01-1014_33]|nr:MAG: hypothetical protein G01um101433_468 [Parcubacteria group bacterium Gr01-1014_33]
MRERIEKEKKMPKIPQIIKDVGFDFHWSEEKVWKLEVAITEMDIRELLWHFDVPFLDAKGERYNLTPREMMEHPDEHPEEHTRTLNADMRYPLDIMENKGRWLMLDGLHRLMKAYLNAEKSVRVRIIPRERIPEIVQ